MAQAHLGMGEIMVSDPVSSWEDERGEAMIWQGLWALFLLGMLMGGIMAWGVDQWLTP